MAIDDAGPGAVLAYVTLRAWYFGLAVPLHYAARAFAWLGIGCHRLVYWSAPAEGRQYLRDVDYER